MVGSDFSKNVTASFGKRPGAAIFSRPLSWLP
jgi:hypothetical protein